MKLSPAAEFAVRGVVVLAERYGQGPVTLDTVCALRDLSKQYLTKIFGTLARAGIVTPIRGKHGGYVLGREPRTISLLDVIEAIEGPIAMNFCQSDPPRCDREECPVRPVWTEIQKMLRERLATVTLADVLNGQA